jgi:phospholipid transport system substrate-binding protein
MQGEGEMRRDRLATDNVGIPLIDQRTRSPGGAPDQSGPGYIAAVISLVNPAKIIITILVVVAGILTAVGPVAAESPVDFIRTMGNQGLAVIRSNATMDQKAAYFHQLLRQDFDLTDISRFVLGSYWRVASEEQRQEFRSLLEDHIVRFYGKRFGESGGENLRVTGSRADAAGVIVTSQIIRPQGAPIEVDWRLEASDGRYKISDVIIDRVSMALTQRSEFAAIIQRGGGQVSALLATLREKG